jgi:plastocyanin
MRLPTFLIALTLVVAGCGGGNDKSTSTPAPATTESTGAAGGGGSELKLTADKSALKFDKKTLTAKAGSVTLTLTNPSSIPHNVAVEGNGVDEKGEVVSGGKTSTVTADLKAGEYKFYCSVDGHAAAGMTGTLTVE